MIENTTYFRRVQRFGEIRAIFINQDCTREDPLKPPYGDGLVLLPSCMICDARNRWNTTWNLSADDICMHPQKNERWSEIHTRVTDGLLKLVGIRLSGSIDMLPLWNRENTRKCCIWFQRNIDNKCHKEVKTDTITSEDNCLLKRILENCS